MPDGIYAAAAGMQAQQTRIDLLSNDISNMDTTGYQSQRVAFSDLVYSAEQGVPVGSGSSVSTLGPTSGQGEVQTSDDPMSLAITGPGYFQVKQGNGSPALTRDGSFQLDADGNIVTSTGEKLDPPIQVPKGTQASDISVGKDGSVTVANKVIGKIGVVDVPSQMGLDPIGNNLFAITAASGQPKAASSTIEQGALESSNVDLAQTMSDMIDAQRSYELASRAIKTQDELLDDADSLVK
ncbi:MAG TPA: flagellar hook-basal body protein [Gaiellaceae bacterium]|jgi:flagellar basal-body rod protein FlgG|nr:flagellar hook-basal body protein [Gaiellaceae bacterium]